MRIKNKTRWTRCWKCTGDIMTQAECHYVKTRVKDMSLCPTCWNEFENLNVSFIQPERINRDATTRYLVEILHRNHDKEEHSNEDFWKCEECQSVLKLKCVDGCKNNN